MLGLRKKFSLQLSLTITLILFSFVTTRARLSFPHPNPDLYYYGFPLLWHRWNIGCSLERTIYLPALLIDFTFYFSIVWLITALVSKRYRISRRIQNILWFTSIAATLWLLHFFMFKTNFLSSSHSFFGTGTTVDRTLWLGISYPFDPY